MTKKKRVIKVPKAVNGLESANSTQYSNQLAATSSGVISSSNLNQLAPMKLKPVNTVPSGGRVGLSTAAGLLQSAPEAVELLASPFQTSDATSGKEATMQSLQGVAKGIGTGAQIGMTFGPMGAAIGAAAGALTGLVGKKGKEAGMTSFTDYDEGTLGTGLIGAFSNKKLRRRRKQVKMNALNNRAAVAGTEYLQNEYAEDNAGADINSFAQGGNIPSSLAYVDDGELISTPDGSVSKVPEEGKPVDQNLVSLPEGSRVLSNTLKVPGTKKTFAQLGEEMMTKKKSKFNDIYAQNAAKLNEMNNKMIHDMLFEQQEALKAKKGIGKEYKNLTEEFQTGGEKKKGFRIGDQFYEIGSTFTYKGKQYRVTDRNEATPITTTPSTTSTNRTNTNTISRVEPASSSNENSDYFYDTSKGGSYTFQYNNPMYSEIFMAPVMPERRGVNRRHIPRPGIVTQPTTPALVEPLSPVDDTVPSVKPTVGTTRTVPAAPSLVEPLDLVDDTVPEIQPTAITRATITPKITNNQNNNDENRPGVDWLGVASGLAGLAPIMSNLFTSDPERVRANYNPYTRAISNAMSRRRFDINPYIQDITRDRAISDYNASQANTNTGASMAYRLQSAIARNNAIADIRSMQNNADNQYRAEYANMMNNLGQQFVQANNIADEANAQNRAAARNIRRSGLSQLSQWFQNRELMRNQRDRDDAMLELYGPLLDNFTTDVRNRFNRAIRRRK